MAAVVGLDNNEQVVVVKMRRGSCNNDSNAEELADILVET